MVADPELSPPRAVLFDWDSTLVDNWVVVTRAMNAARAATGLAPWDRADVIRNATHSSRDSFARVFGERAEAAKRIFYATFDHHHLGDLTPLPGARELLLLLHELNTPTAIVSNKNGRFLRTELEHLGWQELVITAVGSQDAEADKPDPAPARLALSRMQLDPDPGIWFVGDTYVDMECGQAAGLTPILVAANPDLADGPGHVQPRARFTDCAALLTFLRSATVPYASG